MSQPIPKRMRAMVYRGVNDLRMEDLPVPSIRSSEVLVRIAECGICPTDLKKIQHGTVPAPRIFGHEMAGTVVRVGARVRGVQVGDRVGLHHHVPCLDCHFCRHHAFAQCEGYRRTGVTAGFEPAGGGFAEYVRVLPFCLPGLVRIPSRNSFTEAALLEPVNTVLKGVRQLRLLPGDRVLVAGQGPIGLMFNRLLALQGVQVIGSDLLPSRQKLGRQFGAEKMLDGADPEFATRLRRLTRGAGVDAAVVATPSDVAFAQCQQAVRGGGSVLLFAHTLRGHTAPVDLGRCCVDELAIVGSYSSDFTLQPEVAKLVFSRRIDVRPLVTHYFPLERGPEAIHLVASQSPNALKVLVRMNLQPKAN